MAGQQRVVQGKPREAGARPENGKHAMPPVLRDILMSGVAAVLVFVGGSIVWIDINSYLTPARATADGPVGLGIRDFTLSPVLWLAVAVFAVTLYIASSVRTNR